ncbi:MAG: arsenate reductase ArsC [FCB group bacterium]|nr:arsenate reductase ArsC [FCB group bacterium]
MKILFICAGNSVRSQMAEGWGRQLADNSIHFASAGIQALGVHPLAIDTMLAVGIDISGHKSQPLSDEILSWADYIITLSESVKPYSTFFPSSAKYDHWSIPNPDTLFPNITREEAYADIRDKIRHLVERLIQNIKPH